MTEATRPGDGFYDLELAHIHDRYYGQVARAAAASALEELRGRGNTGGVLVDLGCGSGIASELFADAGFDVVGIDVSAAMLSIARERCPKGRFVHSSIYDARVPHCSAVVAIGEVLNYTNGGDPVRELGALLSRIYEALEPGGFLLFDVASPGRSTSTPASQHQELEVGLDIAVGVTEAGLNLTRDIDVRKSGTLKSERHMLHLWPDDEALQLLTAAGFREASTTSYRDLPFNPGWTAWLARKT